jgi:hypothetical protein
MPYLIDGRAVLTTQDRSAQAISWSTLARQVPAPGDTYDGLTLDDTLDPTNYVSNRRAVLDAYNGASKA